MKEPHRDRSAEFLPRTALTGPWVLDRRASRPHARFIRLTFYRDGRFGTLAVDGRTVVYGDWSVALAPGPGHGAARPDARLTLRFDHHADPSAEYHLSLDAVPLGPLVLTDAGAGDARLVLTRAGAIEAALFGAWQPCDAAAPARVLDRLELRRDGTYLLALPGGAARGGRWSFQRQPLLGSRMVQGTLALDPTDTTLPREHWDAVLAPDATGVLTLVTSRGTPPVQLVRAGLDPAARALVAVWRFVGPAGAPAPGEIVLRGDGTCEVHARPGAPRSPGTWQFQRTPGRPDALEGTLLLSVHGPGGAMRRDRQQVVLPFARGAELQFVMGGARFALRYRRMFR